MEDNNYQYQLPKSVFEWFKWWYDYFKDMFSKITIITKLPGHDTSIWATIKISIFYHISPKSCSAVCAATDGIALNIIRLSAETSRLKPPLTTADCSNHHCRWVECLKTRPRLAHRASIFLGLKWRWFFILNKIKCALDNWIISQLDYTLLLLTEYVSSQDELQWYWNQIQIVR